MQGPVSNSNNLTPTKSSDNAPRVDVSATSTNTPDGLPKALSEKKRTSLQTLKSGGIGFLKGCARVGAGIGAGICGLIAIGIFPLTVTSSALFILAEPKHADRGRTPNQDRMALASKILGAPYLAAASLGYYAVIGKIENFFRD